LLVFAEVPFVKAIQGSTRQPATKRQNTGKRKKRNKFDILVVEGLTKVVIEFKASPNRTKLQKGITQVEEYVNDLVEEEAENVRIEGWLVNYYASGTDLPPQRFQKGINIVYITHDVDFRNVSLEVPTEKVENTRKETNLIRGGVKQSVGNLQHDVQYKQGKKKTRAVAIGFYDG